MLGLSPSCPRPRCCCCRCWGELRLTRVNDTNSTRVDLRINTSNISGTLIHPLSEKEVEHIFWNRRQSRICVLCTKPYYNTRGTYKMLFQKKICLCKLSEKKQLQKIEIWADISASLDQSIHSHCWRIWSIRWCDDLLFGGQDILYPITSHLLSH